MNQLAKNTFFHFTLLDFCPIRGVGLIQCTTDSVKELPDANSYEFPKADSEYCGDFQDDADSMNMAGPLGATR